MARRFDTSFDSPVGVGDILSAFADDDYWRARLAAFENGTATLNGLTVEPDGAVTVDLAVKLFADRLPTAVTKLAGGDLGMARIERWSWIDDEQACGAIEVAVPRAPVTAHGEVLLTPFSTGSQLRFSTTVDVQGSAGRRVHRKLHHRPPRRRHRCSSAFHRRVDRVEPLVSRRYWTG